MDGAQVAVGVADPEYTVMAVEDAETGTQRYVRTTSRVLIGSVAAPVFVLDQTQDGGSASAAKRSNECTKDRRGQRGVPPGIAEDGRSRGPPAPTNRAGG